MATRKKASAKTTKTTAKASKLEQMSQTHGKEENFQATTLDQIWGDTGNTKILVLLNRGFRAPVFLFDFS